MSDASTSSKDVVQRLENWGIDDADSEELYALLADAAREIRRQRSVINGKTFVTGDETSALPKLEYNSQCVCCVRNKITVEVFTRPRPECICPKRDTDDSIIYTHAACPMHAVEPPRELSASEAASFDKTLARSPRRVEPTRRIPPREFDIESHTGLYTETATPEKASGECCLEDPGGGFVCTLPKGHADQHEAYGTHHNLLQSWSALKASGLADIARHLDETKPAVERKPDDPL